jgi:hypothetical protein
LITTHLGEDQAVLEVDILALDITSDSVGVRVLLAGDLEGDVGRGEGLDLERRALDGVVFEEKVRGGLSEVLYGSAGIPARVSEGREERTFQDGGTGWDIAVCQLLSAS